jgi:DNA topoisomerase-2
MTNGLDDDIFALMSKRVYDMAGIMPKVNVTLNDKEIDIKSFTEYVDMYFEKDSSPQKIFDKEINTERWEVIVSVTDGEFKQVSFVNSVCTSKGGTHVNYLVDQIVDKIQEKIKKKEKDLNIKPFQIKAHIWVFVNCLI